MYLFSLFSLVRKYGIEYFGRCKEVLTHLFVNCLYMVWQLTYIYIYVNIYVCIKYVCIYINVQIRNITKVHI